MDLWNNVDRGNHFQTHESLFLGVQRTSPAVNNGFGGRRILQQCNSCCGGRDDDGKINVVCPTGTFILNDTDRRRKIFNRRFIGWINLKAGRRRELGPQRAPGLDK